MEHSGYMFKDFLPRRCYMIAGKRDLSPESWTQKRFNEAIKACLSCERAANFAHLNKINPAASAN